MNRKVSLGVAISMAVISSAVTICITMLVAMQLFNNSIGNLAERQAMYDKLNQIDRLVRENFAGKIDEEYLKDNIAKGYIYGLNDKFSSYYTAEESAERKEELSGNSQGMGIISTEHPDNKTIYIVAVHSGSPADKAGLKAGDQIIKVGDALVSDIGYSKAYSALKGKKGQKKTITVLSSGEERTIEITYDEFKIQSVFYHMIDNIGYIKITEFNAETTDQFKNAVKTLKEQGADALIFDVRKNGGGTVDSAAKILDFLLPEGNIMSVRYANGKDEVLHKSDPAQIELPMAVLVDKQTASAAELFAAAIRDYDKGILVGSQTYGKGVMQRTYYLSDGSSIKITVAEYTPPSGVSFNGIGLDPDVKIDLNAEQEKYYYIISEDKDPVVQGAVNNLKKQIAASNFN
ncbi:MAG TPA: S41 family peptidase [Clostridiales bacterium]|nr:S41 family peptidase [Clostridiales bacterium]